MGIFRIGAEMTLLQDLRQSYIGRFRSIESGGEEYVVEGIGRRRSQSGQAISGLYAMCLPLVWCPEIGRPFNKTFDDADMVRIFGIRGFIGVFQLIGLVA
jgi:hypothetical protein